jgi:type IX secretion system PorP/SprF family membrane protein
MKNTLLLLLALLFANTTVSAQIHRFTNPISAPLHFNPAFAGSVDDYRISLAYRNAGASLAGTQTFYGSYDQVSNRLHGAFGAEVYHDISLDRMYDTRISGIYAGKIALGDNIMFSPALKVGYQRWSIEGFYYTDINDPVLILNEPMVRHGLNFSPSVLLNTSNFYIGLTVDQMASLTLKESQWSKDIQLRPEVFWNLQAGYRFEPGQSGKWSLSTTGLMGLGKRYRDFQGQVMYNRRWFLAGIGAHLATGDAGSAINYQASLGFKHDKFRVLGVYTTYSNQFDLSLMLYLPRKKVGASPESSGR